MNNNNSNEKDVSLSQKPNEENIITKLTLAGLTVHIVRQNDQIIYKLPDNMQVSSIAEEQRQQLMKEIQELHATTMAQQQQLLQQNTVESSTKAIAPRSLNSLDAPPEPTAAEATALEETARSLREELEQQQKMQLLQQQTYGYNTSSPNDNKTTRKYNKTGKYSKKRQQQLQQQQQQQQSYQQFIQHLQQGAPQNESIPSTPLSVNSTTTNGSTAFSFTPIVQHPAQQDKPVVTPTVAPTPQQVALQPATPQNSTQSTAPPDSILTKRLPEEELQHREIKKRFIASLISDRKAVVSPNYEKPFTSVEDAINRLLPYHIYQYPKDDLDSNQIPLDRQDNTMIEIFKCQTEMFEKHNKLATRTDYRDIDLKTLLSRQIVTDQRQKVAEEQARIDAEQAAQREEALRIQQEKARLEQMHQQQQMLQQQQQQFQSQQFQQVQQPQNQQFQQVYPNLQPQPHSQPVLDQTNYANGLAQATALLQNPQFINHYSQLSPELQQKLLQNREQLMALIEKQQINTNNQ